MFPFQDDNPTTRTPVATYAIIAINVLVYLWTLTLPAESLQSLQFHRGFVPARIAQLRTHQTLHISLGEEQAVWNPFMVVPRLAQPTVTLTANRGEILLSLLTCMFLHGGLLHLLGNMWFLWIFGDNVEDRLGPVVYVLLYSLGGLLATFAHWAHDPGSVVPVIGASGAIATVLGAYAVTWPFARVHTLIFLFIFVTIIDLPALVVLGLWFLGQLAAGMQPVSAGEAASVAFWAHIGGFIAGMLLMPFFSSLVRADQPRPREEQEYLPW